MDPVWTWGGTFFGFLDIERLWTCDGKYVGERRGDDIYGSAGQYLGEVKEDDRLITDLAKSECRVDAFTQLPKRPASVPYANDAAYVMWAGYDDFPPPNAF